MNNRYIIKSPTHGYFRNSNSRSLYYGSQDFIEDIREANQYKNLMMAEKMARKLFSKFDVEVIPVCVTITEAGSGDVELFNKERLSEYKQFVSDNEGNVDELSNADWNRYKHYKKVIEQLEFK